MFKSKKLISAVEIGSSKIAVMVGEADDNGKITLIGHGQSLSGSAVRKGEICDMDAVLEPLSAAFEQADKACGQQLDKSAMFLALSACGIESCPGQGSVFIESDDSRVSEDDVEEAIGIAGRRQIPAHHEIIGTFDSYYMLDGKRRVQNPLNQVAGKLDAHIHIIHGDRNRFDNFRNALRDVGINNEVSCVFSPVAAAYGVLSAEERQNGVLLLDIGSGTTEYFAIYNEGVLGSGYIGVGCEHLINDLSLALDLPVSACRRIINDSQISSCRSGGRGFLEVKDGGSLKERKIPLASLERVVNMRLDELFSIIAKRLELPGQVRHFGSGAVICGGGALFAQTLESARGAFKLPVRVGIPVGAGGSVGGLNDPRLAVLWGLLKYGQEWTDVASLQRGGVMTHIIDAFDAMSAPLWRRITNIRESVKF